MSASTKTDCIHNMTQIFAREVLHYKSSSLRRHILHRRWEDREAARQNIFVNFIFKVNYSHWGSCALLLPVNIQEEMNSDIQKWTVISHVKVWININSSCRYVALKAYAKSEIFSISSSSFNTNPSVSTIRSLPTEYIIVYVKLMCCWRPYTMS